MDSRDESRPVPAQVLASIDYLPKHLCPQPPSSLEGWLDPAALTRPGPEDPRLVERVPSRESPADYAVSGLVEVAALQPVPPEILQAYRGWLTAWREWARYELDAEPLRRLHRQLAQMSQESTQADDRFETVLGAGLLTREVPRNRQVSRHVVCAGRWLTQSSTTSRSPHGGALPGHLMPSGRCWLPGPPGPGEQGPGTCPESRLLARRSSAVRRRNRR